MILALSAVPTTTLPIGHSTGGGGHNWWEIVGSIGAIAAALTGAYLVYALRRTHASCLFGPARWQAMPSGNVQIEIPVHVVPGAASWVVAKFSCVIKHNGTPLQAMTRRDMPTQDSAPYRNTLIYDIRDPHGPVVVDLRVKFKHGGRAKLHQTVMPPD